MYIIQQDEMTMREILQQMYAAQTERKRLSQILRQMHDA